MLVLSEGDDDKEKGKVAPKALLFLLLLKPSQGFTMGRRELPNWKIPTDERDSPQRQSGHCIGGSFFVAIW